MISRRSERSSKYPLPVCQHTINRMLDFYFDGDECDHYTTISDWLYHRYGCWYMPSKGAMMFVDEKKKNWFAMQFVS
jgi:hypothetical protein